MKKPPEDERFAEIEALRKPLWLHDPETSPQESERRSASADRLRAEVRADAASGRNAKQARKQGGGADKRPRGIWAAIECRLRDKPETEASKLWESFPIDPDVEKITEGVEYELFRSGIDFVKAKLVQRDCVTGKDHAIGWRRFQEITSEVRKKLRADTY